MGKTNQYQKKITVTSIEQTITLPPLRNLNIRFDDDGSGNSNGVYLSFNRDIDADSLILYISDTKYWKRPKDQFLHLKSVDSNSIIAYLDGERQFQADSN